MAVTPELGELLMAALEARKKAYAPYSNFLVGAALRTDDGKVISGCNVENSSYGLAICAERNAICQAVARGYQNFTTIVVVANPLATPCGACRQFIFEFGSDIEVVCADALDVSTLSSWSISELLPKGFRL